MIEKLDYSLYVAIVETSDDVYYFIMTGQTSILIK